MTRKRKYHKHKKIKSQSYLGFICLIAAIYTLVTFFSPASDIGVQEKLATYFGWGSFFAPLILIDLSLVLLIPKKNRLAEPSFFIALLLLALSTISLIHLFQPVRRAQTAAFLGEGGGMLGYTIENALRKTITPFFTFFALLLTICGSLVYLLNIPGEKIKEVLVKLFQLSKKLKLPGKLKGDESQEEVYVVEPAHPQIDFGENEKTNTLAEPKIEVIHPLFSPNRADNARGELRVETVTNPPYADRVWEYPPISILSDGMKVKMDKSHLNQNARIIEHTLESFGVQAKVVEVNLGPAITQYALELTHGTKISKITNLQNDLALALAAKTGTVRIEAPIPGRSLVGIEVPNEGLKVVNLKGMLTSSAMQSSKSILTVALGEDVSGKSVIADISKMPHVLIAGTTGSGKSVLINAMLATLLFRASPWEVKLILVDPKRVELSQYRDIPHLLTEVIVEPEKVVAALKWALDEMTRRYKLFEKAGVKNIAGYNEAAGFQALPYILIVVDELGDIIMTSPREVESAVCRLAQLARAVGIHLILATQRPSVDVLTGLIKANIPCRIAFNVSSMVDSRVIIDNPGAEKLLGRGDMLYVPPDTQKPARIQGVFVDDREVHALIDFLRNSGFKPDYKQEIVEYVSTKFEGGNLAGDELFTDAVKLVIDEGYASTSLLQRKLKIGYNRAANIMDEMETRGIVSNQDGAKKRNILIKDLSQITGNGHGKNESGEHTEGETPSAGPYIK